ncbi:hypothetical protein BAE44_0003674 [Dichanthelium oligosanthes]|uniref:Pentatricopeptide repeat-containing protein n=1 Tax=Dichanthelium oligosanthes TaxID=888268 RepID=A0A1E5WD05_9POAL|nr:hypothetical protein BAE44_0003674 [Dichanthelium oligosanthes]
MSNCKRHTSKDYTTMVAVLMKLDEITEAEALLKEWESSKNAFNFHVPNVLLTGWAIVAIGYAEKGNVAKAYELTKNALRVYAPNSVWIPRPSMIEMILKYLGDEGELKDVETFVDLLKVAVPMNSDMTEALSRARARQEKKVEETNV